ncbi:HAMP domain-containing protein [Burkholderia sp. Bp8963]|uniref:ATP-binding protein n=1 Tax=Burkholderia sp. Bp8963 TaxID=2184547 RepID=UPI000F59081A|nr:ATP-binding protein [Burkholderia sp. Bp8963]RQS61516.1 HAMP domain-containing protein [Burkholderia sp. Bp8963]
MSTRNRLSRQIVLSMGLVSVTTTLIVLVGSFIIYGLLFTLSPPSRGSAMDLLIPHPSDYLIFAMLLMTGLLAAVIVATRLARRILTPLNSLAEGARRIAAGDLAARATPGDRSLGETALLVDDFNAMAVRLQGMASDMTAWNAAIVHELRTPLTILRGRLQGLKDGVFAPDTALFRGLLHQVEGLSRLVDDLHIVTLQDIGRLEMNIQPTDIALEVQSAVDSVGDALHEAGFSVELATPAVVLQCDGTRIRQALLALLDNARRYAVPGKLRIELAVVASSVVLRVEDEGPGLSPEFARHAFEPFTRADVSRSRQFGGSGLGLSVVRAIAQAHHGQVRYCTSRAGGSIFELEIPR